MKHMITSLAGGLIETVRPDLLNDGQVQICNNMKVDTLGVLIPVNDLSSISELDGYNYVWLWRMYKKPYVYNGTEIVESPYNYVYLCYNSSEGTLDMLGYYNLGSTKTPAPTLQFKTGDGTYGAISITVAQKPSLALTNMRCTIVDGVGGNNARYIEIDDDNNVIFSDVGVIQPEPLLAQNGKENTSATNIGIGDIQGTFYGYCFTFVDTLGVESNPSPIHFNISNFIGGDQQIYRGDFESAEAFVKGVKLLTEIITTTHSDYMENIEKINIYRTASLYTESTLEVGQFRYVGSSLIGSEIIDYNSDDFSGSIVSYENDNTIKGEESVTVGNMIMVTDAINNLAFPLAYPKYIKIKLSNKNSRNYINGIFTLYLSDSMLPSDFPTLPTSSGVTGEISLYRFFMSDFTTPIPTSYQVTTTSNLIYSLRIPIIYSNNENIIYLAYYPTGSANPSPLITSVWNKYMMGRIDYLSYRYIDDFYDEGDTFVKRNTVKDERDRLVLGGSNADNAYSFDTCDITDIEYAPLSWENLPYDRTFGTGGLNFTNIGTSAIKTKVGFIDSSVNPVYSAYGFFKLDYDNMETYVSAVNQRRYLVFGDVYGNKKGFGLFVTKGNGHLIFGVFNLDSSDISEANPIDNSYSFGNITHTSGLFSCFIFISIDRAGKKVSWYISNLIGDVLSGEITDFPDMYSGGRSAFVVGRDVNLQVVWYPASIPPAQQSDTAIKYLTDFHYQENLYLNDSKLIENIKNGFPIFDVSPLGVVDYTANPPVNNNITIEDAKSVTETVSQGTIRWSDNAGLVFPTLNELVVGREVIKIVPRLGSKDAYESIVDVYTKNGIYILSIDKLSSTTNLIPLTGESGTFILQNKDSIVTVDSSNYFVSNNTLYQQTGESFTDLSSGKVNIDCDKVTYFPEYKAIGMAKTGNSSVLMYDVEKSIYFKQDINGVLDFAGVSEDGKRMVIFDTSVKTLSDSLVTTGLKVKSKRFYVGLASLIRFNIEFESRGQDYLFTVRSIFENTPRIKKFAYIETDGAIALNIDSNKWYHFPNGLICEYFELELFNYRGIKKIEIEYRPRGRR